MGIFCKSFEEGYKMDLVQVWHFSYKDMSPLSTIRIKRSLALLEEMYAGTFKKIFIEVLPK